MAKFSRRPCAKCEVDTLHRGPVCTVCGTVVRFSRYQEIRKKGVRYQAAQLKRRFGGSYDSRVAHVAIAGRMGFLDTDAARIADRQERRTGDTAPSSTTAPFGRGRERTRI